jgi:acyl dehydratase
MTETDTESLIGDEAWAAIGTELGRAVGTVVKKEFQLPKCPRRMAGGDDITFLEPVYAGDVITSVRTLEGLEEKTGRTGAFVLMHFRTTYTREDGVVVAETASSLIARPANS